MEYSTVRPHFELVLQVECPSCGNQQIIEQQHIPNLIEALTKLGWKSVENDYCDFGGVCPDCVHNLEDYDSL